MPKKNNAAQSNKKTANPKKTPANKTFKLRLALHIDDLKRRLRNTKGFPNLTAKKLKAALTTITKNRPPLTDKELSQCI